MAVKKFQQSPSLDLSALYDFLNANKEGTFLENVTLTLTKSAADTENGKIVFDIGEGELFIESSLATTGSEIVSYQGEYITNLMGNYGTGSSRTPVYFEAALLCSKGLIISVNTNNSNSGKQIDRIIITVDNDDKLALITPSEHAFKFASSDTGYNINAYDSTELTTVSVSPAYGMNKTSLAPVALTALSTDRYLPYAYAALTTQLDAEGLQSVLIDGAPFITNGIWYIKDGD